MSAFLIQNAEQVFLDNNGIPLVGGSVYFYIPATLTPKDTWKDSAQTILNTNPVILDSAGRAIIFGTGVYRQIVKDALGNTIWDQLSGLAYNSPVILTNGESSATAAPGMPVYASGNDVFRLGIATSLAASSIIGIAASSIAHGAQGSVIPNGNNFAQATGLWDAITGQSGGLTRGSYYFVSGGAAGHLTITAPTTLTQCVSVVGLALSTTELVVAITPPILL